MTDEVSETIGGNVAAVLKGYVERIEQIDQERKALQEDIKDRWKSVKALGLPVRGLKSLHSLRRKDQDKLSEMREEMKDAGALLGIPVYVGEVIDDGTDPFPKTKQEAAQQAVAAVERLEDELKALGEDRKDVLSQAKSTGFSVKALETIITIRRDPEAHTEHSQMVDLYKAALGMA